jgi:hypothetical protein
LIPGNLVSMISEEGDNLVEIFGVASKGFI